MVLDRLKNKITARSESSDALLPEGNVDEIGSENQSILMGIISQLRPGCDLTRITLPTFILEKKSMLERITNAFLTPDIVLEATETQDEVQRFLLIVKWYLSSWHIAPKAVKKPLNPVLGEVYSCYWPQLPDGSTAYYLSEQTSHHPPELSYFYLIPERKVRADGVVIPRSKFLGNSSAAMMEGIARVTLGEFDEEYTLTQPNIYCRGILFGKLKYELGDHMIVRCPKNNLEADIEFKTKGFISGAYDTIEGKVRDTKTSKVIYTISGKWNGVMEIEDAKGNRLVLYDTSVSRLVEPNVKPLESQLPHESRNLWQKTLAALEAQDHKTATDEKFKVEEDQRLKAKERTEKGISHEPAFFHEDSSENLPFVINANIDVLNDSPEEMVRKLLEVYDIVPSTS